MNARLSIFDNSTHMDNTKSAQGNGGLSSTNGNTDAKSVCLDAGFVARTDENRITIGGEYNREETEGVTTADRALGNLKYDHFITAKCL